jgi:pimeloyl-ACP methyl ester carboxylesterase
MKIIYIHGANATSDSFNYIRTPNNDHEEASFDYNSSEGFYNNLETMQGYMRKLENVFFVAHSLGGIYALHLASSFPEKVLGAVTIATPYGGIESADYTRYFLPFNRLLKDVGPCSDPIKTANRIKVQHPWTQIVTTKGGSPWISEPNDGVVTIASMRHRRDMIRIEMESNHYEVMIKSECVNIIKTAINNLNV